ncbi:MAG: efflux RND transporter periplasmic adaptor subunit [Candidatus Adiutrix sp.]|jgi:membrane fusion protein (multidrug efflux system)|nr:efflux RND transporter periplasmic adaptor subunit [Candidatus Adiutrix sp.]
MNPETMSPATAAGRRALARALAFFFALGLLGAGWWWFFSRPFESTDDAYVTGNQVRIAARTSGTVREILADDTVRVRAGQVLARLDPTDAALALAKAKADLATAVRQTASRLAQRDRLAALVEMRTRELTMNRNDYTRRQRLKTGQSVTAEEVERYREQTAIAEAALAAARHELAVTSRLVGDGPLAGQPEVLLAADKVREAWLALDRCEIRSPVAGQVARRTVQVGAQVTPQTPLMVVTPLDQVWVEANFKETQLARVRPGQRARVKVDLYGGRIIHQARVAGLGAGTGSVFSLLPPENATGNWIKVVQRVPVRLILDPGTLAEAPLRLGLSCRAEVLVSETAEPLPEETPFYEATALTPDLRLLEEEIAALIDANSGDLKDGAGR